MTSKNLLFLAFGGCLLALPASLPAQQDQSVVDAARKARAERKAEPKPKIVVDDDTVGNISGTINIVGQEPPAPTEQAKGAATNGEKKPKAPGEKTPVKDEDYWRAKFADANRKLAEDQRDLDVTQREYNLKQQQYYTDPNATLKQEYTRQDLNDTKAKIDEKTAIVAQDKADIDNLQDQLRQAGGDPGWASPSSAPPAQSQQ